MEDEAVSMAAMDARRTLNQDKRNTLGQSGIDLRLEPKDEVLFRFERVRFTIPYIIYKRINQWRMFDTVALNFHLVTAFTTVFLCTNWQISVFMLFQLICTISMCLRVSYSMYKYGRQFKYDDKNKGLTENSKRDNIAWD